MNSSPEIKEGSDLSSPEGRVYGLIALSLTPLKKRKESVCSVARDNILIQVLFSQMGKRGYLVTQYPEANKNTLSGTVKHGKELGALVEEFATPT